MYYFTPMCSVPGLPGLILPRFESFLELRAIDKKVIAVAIASLVFFGVQMSLSLGMTFLISSCVTLLTYLSETYIRTEGDWFNTQFDPTSMILWSSFLLLKPVICRLASAGLGRSMPTPPQLDLVRGVLTRPLVFIPVITVVAPITEEILFRGFLLERLEDGLAFCHLSPEIQKKGEQFSSGNYFWTRPLTG